MFIKVSEYLTPKIFFIFILTFFQFVSAQDLKTESLTRESAKLTSVVNQSSYSLKQALWQLVHTSNGKGWTVLEGENYDSYKLIINAHQAIGMTSACLTQAPILILNFKALGENRTQVQVDLDSNFYGQTLRQLFTANNKLMAEDKDIDSDKNVFRYEVISAKAITLFGLYLRVNTNPKDDEEFGDIALSFSEHSIDLSVFDGDDDGGKSLVIAGANKYLQDTALPNLNIFCQ